MKIILLVLFLAACTTTGIYQGSGEVAPTPPGHADLCAKQHGMPGCPK